VIEMPTEADPVKVIEGDCLDVLPELAAGCIDAVVTDPPYLTADAEIEYEHTGVAARTQPTTTVGMPWGYSLDWVDAAGRLNPAHWIVFAHFKMLGGLQAAIERYAEISALFAWRKSNAPNMARPLPRMDCEFIIWARRKGAKCDRMGEFRSLVIDCPGLAAGCMATERLLQPGSGKAAHPCQKPLSVVRQFINRLDVARILDPFAGSGTTAIAALKEGRRCILIEKDASYAAICRKRVAKALDAGLFAVEVGDTDSLIGD
jgi:site-specific DNA-methyltransferase (adenine-specific)